MPLRYLLVLPLLLLGACARADDTLSSAGDPSPASTFTLDPRFVVGLGQLTDFRWLPDGRLVAISKTGTVYVRPAGGGALTVAGTFAVDTASEKGLLGLAVDPRFRENGRLFFYYSAKEADAAAKHRVVVRKLGADGMLATEETVLVDRLRGPMNHDGGALEVGPDGYLYIGVGDTGCNSQRRPEPPAVPSNFYATCLADDPTEHGGANGKILRVALDGSIPRTNPLVNARQVTACGDSCRSEVEPKRVGAPRTEVFAWGFRNPWRLWADPRTGKIWVGDVGEITYEEIDVVEPGRHHGWPWREAAHGYPPRACRQVRIGTAPDGSPIMDQDCVDPVYYCDRGSPGVDGDCMSITGGQIVDSCTWPAPFRGRYVFGDNVTRYLWTLAPNAARDGIVGGRADFGRIEGGIPVTIRTGPDGALYVAVHSGRLVRIAPKTPVACHGTCAKDAECDDGDACTVDTCDAAVGTCVRTRVTPCTG
jgi:glucose/arabinose dehydrogenase